MAIAADPAGTWPCDCFQDTAILQMKGRNQAALRTGAFRVIAAIHPTGNQNVRHVLAALHARNLLALFGTAFGHSAEAGPPRWVPGRWREEWNRRALIFSECHLGVPQVGGHAALC